MVSTPVIVALLAALVALIAFGVRSMWRDRGVDFIHRVALGAHAGAVAEEVFDEIVPVLVGDRYRMVAQAGHTTIFERRSSWVGPIIISILLFPFGLLALLGRSREMITVVSGEAALELRGYCRKTLANYLVAVADEVAAQHAFVD